MSTRSRAEGEWRRALARPWFCATTITFYTVRPLQGGAGSTRQNVRDVCTTETHRSNGCALLMCSLVSHPVGSNLEGQLISFASCNIDKNIQPSVPLFSSSVVQTLNSAQGEFSYHVPGSVYMVHMAPTRQLHTVVCPLLSLEVATPESKINFNERCHPYARKVRL